jgi:hypothetical protein
LAIAQDQQATLAHVQGRTVGLQGGAGEVGLARLHGRGVDAVQAEPERGR